MGDFLKHSSLSDLVTRLWSLVPSGGSLPEEVWRARHRFLLRLTWAHALVIALVGPVSGYSWELSLSGLFRNGTVLHTIGEGLIVALCAILGSARGTSRTFQAIPVGFGLMSASAILVHLSGGYIELHFHFFVMLIFLALYQDWVPYILAITYVAIHHGVVGVLWPEEVYNHAAALNAPWSWAGIHAFFVLWASVGSVIAWRFGESASAQTKLILESAGEGIYGLDREGRVTFINRAAVRMLGLEGIPVVGRPMHEIVQHAGADGASFPGGTSPILSTLEDRNARQATDETFRRQDGTGLPVDYVATPMIERGQLTGAVVSFTDVTERRRAAGEMERHVSRLTALRDINLAITSTLDLRAVLNVLMEKINLLLPYAAVLVWLVNRESGQLKRAAAWNLDEERWKARGSEDVPPLIRMTIENKVPAIVRNIESDPRIRDREFYRRQGFVSYLGIPMIVKGELFGALVFLTREEHQFTGEEIEFLTTLSNQAAIAIHNVQLYEQTKKQAAELERASKTQADFTAMIVHDLRSPLMSIMSVVGMMAEGMFGTVNEEQKKWLARVGENSQKLADLVGDFLDLSRLEAGHIGVHKERTDLGRLVGKAVDNFSIPSKDKGITLSARVDPAIPRIEADPRRLDQVLTNLLSNAVKFTEEGGKIEIRACRENSAVKIQVKDTGVGIPRNEIGELFRKYRQTSSSRGSKQKGTGLGLVICKMIVEAHGGRIWAESEEGKGTTFSMTIPLGH